MGVFLCWLRAWGTHSPPAPSPFLGLLPAAFHLQFIWDFLGELCALGVLVQTVVKAVGGGELAHFGHRNTFVSNLTTGAVK